MNLGDMVQVWVSEVRQNSSKRERPSLILAMDENRKLDHAWRLFVWIGVQDSYKSKSESERSS